VLHRRDIHAVVAGFRADGEFIFLFSYGQLV